jgi:hypothetical protein
MKTKPVAVKSFIFKLRVLVLFLFATFLFIAQPTLAKEALSDDWEFSASVYMWAAGIDGETSTGDDFDVKFKDILDNLDFTLMADIGVNKDKWGFLTDVIYMDIKDTSNQSLNRALTLSKVEIKAWIVTSVVTYSLIQSDRWNLTLEAGARYLDLEPEMKIEGPLTTRKASDSGDAWNGIVGTSGNVNLKHNLYLPFHFDVGTGESKSTWQVFGGIGYKFKTFDIVAGYRYLAYSFDKDDTGGELFNDLIIKGPLLGAKFRF